VKRAALVFILFALYAGFAFSLDLGLLLDNNIEAEDKYFSYSPAFIPWFSWDNGQNISVYLSGIVSLKYNKYDDGINNNDDFRKPLLLPELSRFSFIWRGGQRYSIEAGRVEYTDILEQTAASLFDGLRFRADASVCSVTIGAFYTGFLYKETAKILMTGNDAIEYAKPVEYHNFSFEAIAQFDLNNNEEKLNSQYAQAVLEFFTQKNMRISGGFVFETMENGDGDLTAAFGALAALETDMPGFLNDNLKLTAKFSSGPMNKTFTGFTPLTSITQGMVFPETLSGLWQAKINYAVRLLPTLFAEANASYFGRTYNVTGSEGNLYGAEFWASLAWQPVEDIRAFLGGGVFIPKMGNAYPVGTDTLWKINAGLLLSF
jgi:hypothetical protein